ncbi:hypothetical protein SLA2020_128900 [Shorea laevis]
MLGLACSSNLQVLRTVGLEIPSVLIAGVPVSLFAWLQFPLLLEIFYLTNRSSIFSEKRSLTGRIKAFCFGKKTIE